VASQLNDFGSGASLTKSDKTSAADAIDAAATVPISKKGRVEVPVLIDRTRQTAFQDLVHESLVCFVVGMRRLVGSYRTR
jgi:hypothetical protein